MNARQTVTMIGWIWVALGILLFVSGSGGLLVSTLSGLPASPLPVRSVFMDFLWEHYRAGAAIQVVVAVVVVFTAFMLLRRQSWARVGIQAFSAVYLAWVVYFGIFWLRLLASITANAGPEPFLAAVRIIMSVGGIVVLSTFAFAFGLCIWALNRAAVRAEFRSASEAKKGGT